MKRLLVALLGASMLTIPALAEPVHLRVPPPLAPKVAAFPRILDPDAAGARINAALDRLDARVLAALRTCRQDSVAADPGASTNPATKDSSFSWERGIDAPMRGPHYLALVAADDFYCGGAYPNTAQMVIVYDLDSGQPVDWSRLLPAGLIGKPTLTTASEGSRIVQLQSDALRTRYMAAFRAPDSTTGNECRDALRDMGGLSLFPYPSAAANGLVLLPSDLPHAIAACGNTVTIPAAELTRLHADAGLVAAITAAHAAMRPPG